MLTARENMDVIAAFENVGMYRGAAVMCGCDPKTVKRKVEAHRNFRRLVSEVRKAFKIEQGRQQRRPAVWVPGATLVIDWGTIAGTDMHVFCAVLAWSRVRFIRFARDEKAVTTFAFLAECFEQLGGLAEEP
jgi:hypothetical protein